MILEQVVGDEWQIVAPGGQMLGKTILLAGTCFGDMKVGNVPVLDHQPEGTGGLEAFELAKPLDGENVGRIQFLFFARQLLVLFGEVLFVVDGIALSVGEVQEMERGAVSAALVSENFTFGLRAVPGVQSYPEQIGDQPFPAGDLHAELECDLDGIAGVPPAGHLAIPAPAGQGFGNVHRQRILQEGEHVEQGGLAGAVGPHQNTQAWDVLHPDILEQTVVLDGNGFDLHGCLTPDSAPAPAPVRCAASAPGPCR